MWQRISHLRHSVPVIHTTITDHNFLTLDESLIYQSKSLCLHGKCQCVYCRALIGDTIQIKFTTIWKCWFWVEGKTGVPREKCLGASVAMHEGWKFMQKYFLIPRHWFFLETKIFLFHLLKIGWHFPLCLPQTCTILNSKYAHRSVKCLHRVTGKS